MNHIPKYKGTEIVLMINRGYTNNRYIARTVGCAPETVKRYRQRIENGLPLPCLAPDEPLDKRITQMLNGFARMDEICATLNVGADYVLAIENGIYDRSTYKEKGLYPYLKRTWIWKKYKRRPKDSGYRKVKIGDKGNLRTPYRPDRIFR